MAAEELPVSQVGGLIGDNCRIGRTTNRTTFVTPGKPVGDRPAAWPAARKHTGMPPPYGSDMVLPPGTGDDPAPSPKLVPISALQLSPQQNAKDLLCGLRASPGLRGRPIRINTCQIAQNRLLRVFLLRDGYIPSITTTHLGWDARHWPIPFVNVHRATVAAALAPRSFPEAEHQPVVVILTGC